MGGQLAVSSRPPQVTYPLLGGEPVRSRAALADPRSHQRAGVVVCHLHENPPRRMITTPAAGYSNRLPSNESPWGPDPIWCDGACRGTTPMLATRTSDIGANSSSCGPTTMS